VKQIWAAVSGKKSLTGLVILLIAVAPELVPALGELIQALGWDPTRFLKVAGAAIGVVGLIHKATKVLEEGE
jgi:hypothetical protein